MSDQAPSWAWPSDSDSSSPVSSRSPSPAPTLPPPRRSNVRTDRNRNVQNARTIRDIDNHRQATSQRAHRTAGQRNRNVQNARIIRDLNNASPTAGPASSVGGGHSSNFRGAGCSVGQSQSRDEAIVNLPGCRGAMDYLSRGPYPGHEADFEHLTPDEQGWVRDLRSRMNRQPGSSRPVQTPGPAARTSNGHHPATWSQRAPPSRGRARPIPVSAASSSSGDTDLDETGYYAGRPLRTTSHRAVPGSAASSSDSRDCTDLDEREDDPPPSEAELARQRNAYLQTRREYMARGEVDDECTCQDCRRGGRGGGR